jgi:cytochrome c peroxidase
LLAASLGVACGSSSAVAPVDAGSGASSLLAPATLAALEQLSPESLPRPPLDKSNRVADDPRAAALGHQLFFDPGFSGKLLDSDNSGDSHSLGQVGESGKVPCAGCHVPSAGFLDNRSVRAQVSLGSGWGKRRTRSLLDVGQASIIMWDGRHDALYNQPFQPLESPLEMNSSRLYAAEQIYARYRTAYESIFGPIPIALDDAARFPQLDGATTGCRSLSTDNEGMDCHGMPGDDAEFDHLASDQDRHEITRIWANVGKALGAYERLLSCGQSRFDRWMHGKGDALSLSEQRGAALFVGQREDGSTISGCNVCHSGPFFTDQTFHNVGLRPIGVGPAGSFYDANDHGARDGLAAIASDPLNVRGKFSDGDDGRLDDAGNDVDGAFRTPSLRCASRRPSFMHTGQILTLDDVVSFFARGGDAAGYPGASQNVTRDFTAQEATDLVAFLKSLDGPGPSADLVVPPAIR